MVDFDKSSDKDNKVESEASILQTKSKHIDIWIRITSINTLLTFVNKIKDKLNRRIFH